MKKVLLISMLLFLIVFSGFSLNLEEQKAIIVRTAVYLSDVIEQISNFDIVDMHYNDDAIFVKYQKGSNYCNIEMNNNTVNADAFDIVMNFYVEMGAYTLFGTNKQKGDDFSFSADLSLRLIEKNTSSSIIGKIFVNSILDELTFEGKIDGEYTSFSMSEKEIKVFVN